MDNLAIWVEDQGANYTDTLFDILSAHFSDSNAPLNLSMGIGLAVSQMIMETHGGRLIFKKQRKIRVALKWYSGMNESMLNSLMRLFAIMVSINREVVHILARNFVESFLIQEFNPKLAERYLADL